MKKILICMLCLLTLCSCNQEKATNSENNENQVEKVKNYKNNVVVLKNEYVLKPGDKFTHIDKYLNDYDKLEVESSAVFYSNNDIEIFVGGDGIVKKISLFTNEYALDNGITIDSTVKELEKIYDEKFTSSNNSDTSKSYHIDGINVLFTIKNDKITQIELEVDTYK